jgi:hypothetical protein
MNGINADRLPVAFLAAVFQGLEKHLPQERLTGSPTSIMAYDARKLKTALQEAIDGIKRSLVVLGYGLCGNGLDGYKRDQCPAGAAPMTASPCS